MTPYLAAEGEPGRTLRARREQIGLSAEQLSRASGIPVETIRDVESEKRIVPFAQIEVLAQHLALSPEAVGITVGANGDRNLGTRLRAFAHQGNRLPPTLVSGLTEAAWIIKAQHEMQNLLGVSASVPLHNFKTSGDYRAPAYKRGYELAADTRKKLGLSKNEPILCLRKLAEDVIGIPVVITDLPENYAGATIGNGNHRGIVLNSKGNNRNTWVARSTLAHELGHILWDPDQRLNNLAIDDYNSLRMRLGRKSDATDPVEKRANAFSADFLAPRDAISTLYRRSKNADDGISQIMKVYGISYSVAIHQLENAGLQVAPYSTAKKTSPDDEWKGREYATADFFPVKNPPSRRGKFAKLVIQCHQSGIFSADTAASMLKIETNEFTKNISALSSVLM